jgi:hypothetical protein
MIDIVSDAPFFSLQPILAPSFPLTPHRPLAKIHKNNQLSYHYKNITLSVIPGLTEPASVEIRGNPALSYSAAGGANFSEMTACHAVKNI